MPPSSPEETGTGSPEAELTGSGRGDESVAARGHSRKRLGGEVGPRARRITKGSGCEQKEGPRGELREDSLE